MSELRDAATAFIRKCKHKNNRMLLKVLQPAVVRLNDLGIDGKFSYREGQREVRGEDPAIVMSSNSLHYRFLYNWGRDTLAINGRIRYPGEGTQGALSQLSGWSHIIARAIHLILCSLDITPSREPSTC